MKSGVLLIAAATLAGCGGSDQSGEAAEATSSATVSVTPETPKPSAGDVAACKGYGRLNPDASKQIAELGEGSPLFVTELIFKGISERFEADMVAASSDDLAQARDAAVAGAQSALATIDSYETGTLDLIADVDAIVEASERIATFCNEADPAGFYQGITP